MFDRNRKYDLSKAQHDLPSEDSEVNRHYSQYNAHVNTAFNRSAEDPESNDFNKTGSIDSALPIAPRAKQADELDFDRAVTIFRERRSVVPELETVIRWEHLELEVNAKGKTKKILDDVSGEVNNLEIMAILGPSGAG